MRKPVIIAFADGYADNLLNAKPLLERYEVPATVFVTKGTSQKTELLVG
jgi:peptidoglycan/xylan/chitin deacetylase (PgdA/CDA1 family)